MAGVWVWLTVHCRWGRCWVMVTVHCRWGRCWVLPSDGWCHSGTVLPTYSPWGGPCPKRRRLNTFGMESVILTNFYRCTIESILTGCITVWYGGCTTKDRKVLRSVVRSAEFIIVRELPALQDIFHTHDASGKLAGSLKTATIHPLDFFPLCLLVGVTEVFDLAPVDWRAVSFQGPSGF